METVFSLELKTAGYSLQMTGWSLIEQPHLMVLVFLEAPTAVVALLHHDGSKLLDDLAVDVVG